MVAIVRQTPYVAFRLNGSQTPPPSEYVHVLVDGIPCMCVCGGGGGGGGGGAGDGDGGVHNYAHK